MLSTLSEQKLVFVDLDLTLFDYTIARKDASIAALQELDVQDESDDIYSQIVEHWCAFLKLGFPDLRRQWNDESIYFLTLVLTTFDANSQRKVFFNILDELESCKDSNQVDLLKKRNSGIINDFLNTYNATKNDKHIQEKVFRAYQRFEDATATLQPFSFARNLLSTILNRENYHLFVVTEGDWDIQWAKVQKLGLNNLINTNNFLVTDRLANPEKLLKLFSEVSATLMNTTEPDAQDIKLKLEAIQYLEQQFRLFNSKKMKHFYGHAIHLAVKHILQEYSDTEFPNIPEEQWKSLPKFKLATFGDRYSNDIKPLIDIFGSEKILSIRMLYGKYSSEGPANAIETPDFTVEQLDLALEILMQSENWINKLPIQRPKHFYLDEEDTNRMAWYACIALTLPASVYSMANAMLQDLGFSNTQINKIQDEYIKASSNRGPDNDLEARLRTILKSIRQS